MLKKVLAFLLMFVTALAMAAVDVNKATEKELDAINGIGPVTSKLIMSERKKGDFKNWQDFIDRVKGVGDVRAAKLSADGLTVNGQAFKATTTAKEEKKDTKAMAKDKKEDAKAAAKEEKKDMKAAAKEKKEDAKAAAKDAKADMKADASKPVAATTKPVASAAKPASSAASARAAASAKK
jgi:competence protein ComEA